MPDQTKQDINKKQNANQNDHPAQHLFEYRWDERCGVDQIIKKPKHNADNQNVQQFMDNIAAPVTSDYHGGD